MLQVIQNFKTGELSIKEVPEPALQPNGILVQNAFSLISAGTERIAVSTAKKSLLGKAQSRPDLVQKVKRAVQKEGLMSTIQLVRNKLDAPLALGYSSAGRILAVGDGVENFGVGDFVACAGQGYASHAEKIFVPQNLAVRVPENVDLEEAAFATLGAIAMQGIRQAEITVGEKIAVIGLGLLGLLTVQIAKAGGCRVVGFDPQAHACAVAKELGSDFTTTNSNDFLSLASAASNGYGVDKVIVTASTKDNAPILQGGEILRRKGALVIVGLVPADVPRSPFYEKEIDVKFSCSYGPGRYDPLYEEKGLDYPLPYVRWTENRNMLSFLELVSEKKINLKKIITHKFRIEDAQEAYDLITGKTKTAENYIGILLEYEQQKAENGRKVKISEASVPAQLSDTINIGFIGAGNFAQRFLIPPLKKESSIRLTGVSTAKGINARNVAEKFSFEFATTDSKEIYENEAINAVFIATRHNLHASFATECLKKKKAIYVEKPLAISANDLDELVSVHKQFPGIVMVGFNRRFSPHILELKNQLKTKHPLFITYRINAGFIPRDHWTQDPVEGGGRIIGEVCHFVDLLNHLTGSPPFRLFAESLDNKSDASSLKDSVLVSLKYPNGSVGNIVYSSVGDKALPKEKIEVFAPDFVAVVDDFKKSLFIQKGKSKIFKTSGQDKGHNKSVQNFIEAVKKGAESPIAFNDSVITTLITFKILESMSTGKPMELDFHA